MARIGARLLVERYDTPTNWIDEIAATELYQRLNQLETVARNNADKTASPTHDDSDLLVAILMARPEITSISDLAGKSVAIDDKYSVSNGNVRIAIVAAGAPEVQLRENQKAAIDRLFSGDVPAAILALVSTRAADALPEIRLQDFSHPALASFAGGSGFRRDRGDRAMKMLTFLSRPNHSRTCDLSKAHSGQCSGRQVT